MHYLPSKKFILAIVALAVIFTAGFTYYKYKNSPLKKELAYEKKAVVEPKKLNEFLDKDTDNDGLKDWEEALWKTDPNNPDTDKDGILDGAEVKLNRDPVKAGPNDQLETEKGSNDASSDTLTDRIGKEFLIDYLARKGKDNLTDSQKKTIVNSMITKLINPSEEQTSVAYELKDIKTSDDNSKEAVKKYANEMGVAFQNFNSIETAEMAILSEILFNEEEEFPEKIEELKANRLVYEKTVKDTLKIIAPKKYENVSLDITNTLNETAKNIAKMEIIYTDPAQTTIAIQNYFDESKNTIQILKNFKDSLNKDKIFLKPDEPGYMFTTSYISSL